MLGSILQPLSIVSVASSLNSTQLAWLPVFRLLISYIDLSQYKWYKCESEYNGAMRNGLRLPFFVFQLLSIWSLYGMVAILL